MTNKQQRSRYVQIGAWIGIVGNLLLAVFKAVAGVISDSRALVADAVHSASDVAGSIAVLIGVRAAQRPPDRDHPYGHGKAETITAIIVAVLLVLVGFEIALSSVQDMFEPVTVPKTLALYAIMISIVLKEAMFRVKYYLGKKYQSDALLTDAWHHRSDVFSSAAVLVGVGAALVGSAYDINWLLYADLAAGIFVALLIIRMGWKLGKEAVHNTLDHVLHDEDTVEMRQTAAAVDGVLKVDEFHAREHGHYVIIDIKIAVDPYITVEEGHQIGKQVKEALMAQSNVQDVLVHINPHEDEEGRSELRV
ncbi:cation diffusion facilitator family transporter [Salsuginibacillus halophilus]|uniref:Cation diffusion facilitator family transporter n=1 Tax=Salsuginibacillus halophilus TaxID=517424 RepID=A0A2P8HFW7_9BACI|nr:cation diffusion facilitator family transporter [Salsuginibacillus halophilus]PSL45112.1 cation diffusion facilitator family transporter [Salsuginibacillus halophilus]